jgi:hypothetical protein
MTTPEGANEGFDAVEATFFAGLRWAAVGITLVVLYALQRPARRVAGGARHSGRPTITGVGHHADGRSDGEEVDGEFPSAFAFVVDVVQFAHQGFPQGFRCAFSDTPAG